MERLRLGIPEGRTSYWDCHHLTAVAEGGTDLLSNVQTLCVWCHERETAASASARAGGRRAAASPNGLSDYFGGGE